MTTIIVGGGWSGLAAAVTLCQHNKNVIVLEAAKQLGGRARTLLWDDSAVDNGQHLLIGAYQQTLSLLALMGINADDVFQRQALDICIHDPRFPPLRLRRGSARCWPLSLLTNMLRDNGFAITKQLLQLARHAKKQIQQADQSVSALLQQSQQSPRLIEQLWTPLCLATLNTPIATASATVFSHVLLTIFQRADYSDFLITKQPLGDCFPQLAARFLEQHQQQIRLQTRAKTLLIEQQRIIGLVTQQGETILADNIILAGDASNNARLLAPHIKQISMPHEPITTVYLQYPDDVRLQQPVMGFSGQLSQWAFDRSDQTPGLIAIVISGRGAHDTMTKQQLAQQLHSELRTWLNGSHIELKNCLLIQEKRATFHCGIDIRSQRPNNLTEISGLWLAGDIVNNPYPATLEGAIINGVTAAQQLLGHQG